jgi:hypothetical protein
MLTFSAILKLDTRHYLIFSYFAFYCNLIKIQISIKLIVNEARMQFYTFAMHCFKGILTGESQSVLWKQRKTIKSPG